MLESGGVLGGVQDKSAGRAVQWRMCSGECAMAMCNGDVTSAMYNGDVQWRSEWRLE